MALDDLGAHQYEQLHTAALQALKQARSFVLFVSASGPGDDPSPMAQCVFADEAFSQRAFVAMYRMMEGQGGIEWRNIQLEEE